MIIFDFRRRKKEWKKPMIIGIFVVILILSGRLAEKIFEPAAAVLAPIAAASKTTQDAARGFFSRFSTIRSLIAENILLKEENIDLKLSLASRRNLEKENEELKALVGRVDGPAKLVIGEVIFSPNFFPHGAFIIDRGASDGQIEDGALVVYRGKVLVGIVTEAGARQSKVLMMSVLPKIPVLVGLTATPAEARGQGSGNFSITLPKGVPVKVGDTVLFSKYGYDEVKIEGIEYYILSESNILGIIK